MAVLPAERQQLSTVLTQEVTSRKDQVQFWESKRGPYKFVPVSEMVQKFQVGERLTTPLAGGTVKPWQAKVLLAFLRACPCDRR